MTFKINSDLAYHLDQIAQDKYNRGNYYGGRAVENAAATIINLDYPITRHDGDYTVLDGIGDKIHEMIEEWVAIPRTYEDHVQVDGDDRVFDMDDVRDADFDSLFNVTDDESCTHLVAGSIRRKKEYVHDVDIISLVPLSEIRRQIADQSSRFELVYGGDIKMRVRSRVNGLEADIQYMEDFDKMYATYMIHSTGPYKFNIRMRSIAKSMGYCLNQYGLWDENGNQICTNHEKDVFEILGMEYVKPEDRY